MSSRDCSVRERCCTRLICDSTAPAITDMINSTTSSSGREKPAVKRFALGDLDCISIALLAGDHLQRDRNLEKIPPAARTGSRLRRHGHQLGRRADGLDVPPHVIELLTISGGGLAVVVGHRVSGYGPLGEVNVARAGQRGSGPVAGGPQ